MLLAECAAVGVDVRVGHRIVDVGRSDGFRVDTDRGAFSAGSLVLATGGLSIPKMGATGFAHEVAARFGLRLTAIRPGLVPLTFDGDLLALMRPLSGVSLPCSVALGKRAFREAVLFTHRGLSGPAVLQISSYWREGAVTLDLLPGVDAAAFLLERKRVRPKAGLGSVLAEVLPARLAAALEGSVAAADGGCAGSGVGGGGGSVGGVGGGSVGDRGVCQGGGYVRRGGYARSVVPDDGGERGSGVVRDRGGGGCDRLARWV